MQRPTPTEISNEFVTLRPLSVEEADAYVDIGQDPAIWTYLTPEPFVRKRDAEIWIEAMLQRGARTGDVAFSVYDNASGQLAGSSSFLDVRLEHGGLEIGFTWYGRAFQRTHVNTATKLALLSHAFENLGAHRVQLQTDSRNEASQRAIARLGATREGVLRRHKVYPNGYVRDSVMFSIVDNDWADVKTRLESFLG